MSSIAISGMGVALPGENGLRGRVVDNKEVVSELLGHNRLLLKFRRNGAKLLGHVASQIEQKTGIKTRNFADLSRKFTFTDYIVHCAEDTLKNAGVDASKVDGLYFASDTADFRYPAQGVLIGQKLGIRAKMFANCGMACASFANVLFQATRDIRDELIDNALIIAGDITTRLKQPHHNLEPFLFGDGFVGIFIEKGNKRQRGGFIFTNIANNPSYSDLFVHVNYFPRDLGNGSENFQNNDNGLDILGDIDALEMAFQLKDFLENTMDMKTMKISDEINDATKIILPQISEVSVQKGIKKFKEDTGFDIEPHVVTNSAYKHGNIGAGAVLLALKEGFDSGEILKGDNVIFDIAGVGGISTVFKRDPHAKHGVEIVKIEEMTSRPDYRQMIEDTIREREQIAEAAAKRKKQMGVKTNKSVRMDRTSLNRISFNGTNDDTHLSFEPIHRPRQLTRLERLTKWAGSTLHLI